MTGDAASKSSAQSHSTGPVTSYGSTGMYSGGDTSVRNNFTIGPRPAETVIVPRLSQSYLPSDLDDENRAVHIIRLKALQHNFQCVESAAAKQKCSVITVVKADGYGHGAIATAIHLADSCGADAFAVATLEEAILLRKAFEQNPPGRWSKQLASLFPGRNSFANATFGQSSTVVGSTTTTNGIGSTEINSSSKVGGGGGGGPPLPPNQQQHVAAARCRRPSQIRILVLGPPVGFPRCFNEYYHYGIEVMISGPEVAAALLAWVANEKERKRTQVERAAMDAMEQALLAPRTQPLLNNNIINNAGGAAAAAIPRQSTTQTQEESKTESNTNSPKQKEIVNGINNAFEAMDVNNNRKVLRHPSSTLGNVSGQDLAKEVRAILMNQKAASEAAEHEQNLQENTANISRRSSSIGLSNANSTDNSVSSAGSSQDSPTPKQPQQQPVNPKLPPAHSATAPAKPLFGGIEAAAKSSRTREIARVKATEVVNEDDTSLNDSSSSLCTPTVNNNNVLPNRRRLRWHALVDSGMGRLGFKPDPVSKDDKSGRRDTVDILKDMVDAEIHANAPIEFYGMCTHMAEANSTSLYTNEQIDKFTTLLRRVRDAGISIPTVSTDNSAALLTTSLTHFDPNVILTQPGAHTRGYVRCGGAIYGQRPSFTQLKSPSTLTASVRHVAILQQGESVGYDRAYVAPYDVRIATLTIGFADGYPRELGNGIGKVAIRGAVFPIAGNVCMDMCMVELGPAEKNDGVCSQVVVGDTAVLWGPIEDDNDAGQVRLQDLAATLKTTQSALTCGLDKVRVSRLYI